MIFHTNFEWMNNPMKEKKPEPEPKERKVIRTMVDGAGATIKLYKADEFKQYDTSSEDYRVYHFSTGASVVVNRPTELHVLEDNSHRLFDEEGTMHFIPGRHIRVECVLKKVDGINFQDGVGKAH